MDHLLRTLAAVPPEARLLHIGCGDGTRTADLVRLGFDVWACDAGDLSAARRALADVLPEKEIQQRVTRAGPDALGYPDAWFDWVAADLASGETALGTLTEIRRVLRPGAWVWVALASADDAPEALTALAEAAGLALAEAPKEDERDGQRVLRGIYRRTDTGVTA